MDWKTLWRLAGTDDFISLEPDTRLAFHIDGKSAVGRVANFYAAQLTKYDRQTYEEFLPFFTKWIAKESEQLAKAAGTEDEQQMEAFYLALREAYQRHQTRKNKPVQQALNFLYDQKEGE